MLSLIGLPQRILIGAILAVSALVGVFLYGYNKGSAHAETVLAKFATRAAIQVAALEKKNTEISNKVQVEYVDKVVTIKEKEYVYRDLAKNSVPSQHDLSVGWLSVHNASASNGIADPARAADATSSGISDNTALITVVTNYSICQQNAQQLTSLQSWITDNNAAVESTKANKIK